MRFLEHLGKELLFFDGAMGTMLQQAGLAPGVPPDIWSVEQPETVRGIHEAYLRAGCNILTTNTFGCTKAKLADTCHSPAAVAEAAVRCAKEAISAVPGAAPRFVALDVGPTGKLLKPLGDLDFEDAVSLFKESISAGEKAGADLVLVETMSDTYELKAAVLAAKEACNLPIVATVVVDAHGKLLTGGDVAAVAALLEGLRVDALGLNCGLGPGQLLEFIRELRAVSSLPLVLTPNAGIPREVEGETVFDVAPEAFAAVMQGAVKEGVQLLGGCCGTTPAHMEALIAACKGLRPLPVEKKARTVVSSFGLAVAFENGAVLIGERINPTGKPRLREALREENYDFILREGVGQQERGARILDVNAGLPDIDEARILSEIVQRLQEVCDTPLQLDTASSEALARAMRIYNGKPMVNSVNGKEESLAAILPLVQKYGGVLVALTLDEKGIPETAEGRVEIAKRIVERAAEYGIGREDIIVDTLTMTISSGAENARITLEALRRVKEELGVKTILGVSNVSFGLPAREKINAAFFTMALYAGLDAAILNPHAAAMMDAFYSAMALTGLDPQCAGFIARYNAAPGAIASAPAAEHITLRQAVRQGLKQQARELAREAVRELPPLRVIDESLVPALNEVGEAFEKGVLYLPQLLMSAEAAKAAFEVLQSFLGTEDKGDKGVIIVATVEGDIHDIGKNIAKAMLENYQFRVIDLGKDVKPAAVLEAAKRHEARLVGLSALMTTTVESMRRTIALLCGELPGCRIMVGGAVLTEEYAMKIGADRYVKDALASVHYAQEVYGA